MMRALVVIGCLMLSVVLPDRLVAAGESAERFYPFSGLKSVAVSPNGKWIAATASRGARELALVQQIRTGRVASIGESASIRMLAWDGPDRLVIASVSSSGEATHVVANLHETSEAFSVDRFPIPAHGLLVDALPLMPDVVIWQFQIGQWTSLCRVAISDLRRFNELARQTSRKVEIGDLLLTTMGSIDPDTWVIDQQGNPRAALRELMDETSLLMAAPGSGKLLTVRSWKSGATDDGLRPVGLTRNGEQVIVKGYAGRNTIGLYEYALGSATAGKELFRNDQFDVEDVSTDPLTGDLIAASYLQQGERRFHYFSEYRDRFLGKLSDEWRARDVEIQSGTADRQVFAFFESSATNPGDYFVRAPTGTVVRIGRSGENVDRRGLVPVDSFRVRSKDGVEVEAYLTLPADRSRPAPLVVMPHGGPVGIADARSYDPLLQYLASWGFAVLQVNYRGSSGYGRDFEELGRKEWARGIEDDIDAAVEHAMALPSVDETRICIVGASYGGFSALASVVRHPDRYRCAVSQNGASDIPLLYDSSDMADSKAVMAFYEAYVGDLETEREKLIEVSPAYHVEDLEVPILVVYGTKDRRVDPDHSHRMLLMLELFEKPHESLEIVGASHWLTRDEAIVFARAMRRFVSRHLLDAGVYADDPGT